MKRSIILISISIVFLSCTNLKHLTPFDGYNGKPKIVETLGYTINKDSIKELFIFEAFYFDKKGRMVKSIEYENEERKPLRVYINKYDNKGNIVELNYSNLDGTDSHTVYYSYNRYGQLLKEESRKIVHKYTYDRKNRTAELKSNFKNGKFHDRITFKFNKNWQRTELVTYDETGDITLIYKEEYDENGNVIKVSSYDDKEQLIRFTEILYDKQNKTYESKKYKIDNNDTTLVNISKWHYSYDKYDNVIEEKVVPEEGIVLITQNKITY